MAALTQEPSEPRPQLRRLARLEAEALEPEDAPTSSLEAPMPAIGDRIMIVKQPWLDHILAGRKTLELRSRASKPGHVWLGMQGRIFGRVKIGASFTMTVEEFRSREDEHLWPADREPPYARLCGLPMEDIQRLPVPLDYWRPAAAIGWHVYRTKAEDLPLKSRGAKKQEGPTADLNSQPKRSKASHGISQRAPKAAEEDGAEGNQPET